MHLYPFITIFHILVINQLVRVLGAPVDDQFVIPLYPVADKTYQGFRDRTMLDPPSIDVTRLQKYARNTYNKLINDINPPSSDVYLVAVIYIPMLGYAAGTVWHARIVNDPNGDPYGYLYNKDADFQAKLSEAPLLRHHVYYQHLLPQREGSIWHAEVVAAHKAETTYGRRYNISPNQVWPRGTLFSVYGKKDKNGVEGFAQPCTLGQTQLQLPCDRVMGNINIGFIGFDAGNTVIKG